MSLTLVIGNKNYSSWSLRAWLFLRHAGLPFEEVLVPLDTPEFREQIAKYSRTYRVPVLIDAATQVWDSLAICEYLAEETGSGLPRERAARAHARSISAEIHSGFQDLRDQCPMNARARNRRVPVTPELDNDVRRIDEIWQECRRSHAATGPWLFGAFSVADAMYAPVTLRFNTYGTGGRRLSDESSEYLRDALAHPFLGEWMRAAEAEPMTLEHVDRVGQ